MLPVGWYSLTFLHEDRSGYTVVESHSPTGEKELLVNGTGCCAGTYLLNSPGGEWQFAIQAVGTWEIAIGEVKQDKADAEQFLLSATGDAVSNIFTAPGEGALYIFTHEGDGTFAVWLTCTDGSRQLLQNEKGIVVNQKIVEFPSGKCVWEVRTDGSWIISDTDVFQERICKPEGDLREYLRRICDSLKF